MSLRSRALQRAFESLYGPLVFLHEPAGSCLFGASWNGRRESLGRAVDGGGPVLDLGCGGGHLLSTVASEGRVAFGIERSRSMLQRAVRRGHRVALADARRLPVASDRIETVICSYPGPWIKERVVWEELHRVTAPGARVSILLGGTVSRGRLSTVRSLIIRMLYGGEDFDSAAGTMQELGHSFFQGRLYGTDDEWGQSYVWKGVRRDL